MKLFTWTKHQKKPSTYPFNLQEDGLEKLRQLRTRPEFRTFVKILQDVAEHNGDMLLNYKDPGDFRERQGFINALHFVVTLPDTIIDRADEVKRERQRLSEASGSDWGHIGTGPWTDILRTFRKEDRTN